MRQKNIDLRQQIRILNLVENPPPMKVDLGKLSPQQWRSAVIANAKEANPAYTDEIIDKFGFDRVISLGADGMEDKDNMATKPKEAFKYTLLQIRIS